jgi:hypothetical protein
MAYTLMGGGGGGGGGGDTAFVSRAALTGGPVFYILFS